MYMFYVARTHRSRDRTAFEDDWIFSIGRTRTALQIPDKGKKYPRLVGTRGDTPVQYPPSD
jgi:hypothetical protein